LYFSLMKATRRLHLVECPRDAIQGWPHPISTEDKLAYYRVLLRVGFDTLDMGSFVSPKAIPAMADTARVLDQLEAEGIWDQTATRALVIVANERGARDAVEYDSVSAIGFPLSLSPTFQERNTRASVEEAWKRLDAVAGHCAKRGKDLVVYLSMGFGNPYGDAWSEEMPASWAQTLANRFSPEVISLADTVGAATPDLVERVFDVATAELGPERLGAHLHLHPLEGMEKIKAAHRGGCFRFDGALRGVGGCPMAQDDLVGNAPTERLVEWAETEGLWTVGNSSSLDQAQSLAADLFA
jgi:hydroxymethylglutaryl-CoA lyase